MMALLPAAWLGLAGPNVGAGDYGSVITKTCSTIYSSAPRCSAEPARKRERERAAAQRAQEIYWSCAVARCALCAAEACR